jgi:gluconate 5-dehydrogenase
MTRQRGVLAGQVAVVVGASGALGSAAATVLAEAGASVVLAGRDRAALDVLAAQVGQASGTRRALCVPTDVTDADSVDGLVAATLEEHEGIDILVNLAGRLEPAGIPLWEADPAEWQRTQVSNVTGVFLACRAVIPLMLDRGHGRIMNPASAGASVPVPGLGTYCVTKAAVQQLTRVLAAELEGTGISVMDVWMGATSSPMSTEVRSVLGIPGPSRRARDPRDAMAMLVVLAQADPAETNGQTIGREERWVRAGIADLGLEAAR